MFKTTQQCLPANLLRTQLDAHHILRFHIDAQCVCVFVCVCVSAWSVGIFLAQTLMQHVSLPLCSSYMSPNTHNAFFFIDNKHICPQNHSLPIRVQSRPLAYSVQTQ